MNFEWKLAFKNLSRNKRRTIATSIAVISGFIGISLVGAYIFRVQNSLKDSTVYANLQGHIQILKTDSLEWFAVNPKKYVINSELQNSIDEILNEKSIRSAIEFEMPYLSGTGLLVSNEKSQPVYISGIDLNLLKKITDRLSTDFKNKIEILSTNEDTISVTSNIYQLLKNVKHIKDLDADNKDIQLVVRNNYGDMDAMNLKLEMEHTTGLSFLEDNSMNMSVQGLQKVLATDGIQKKIIFLKDYENINKITEKINYKFEQKKLPLKAYDFTHEGIGDFYTGNMNFLYIFALFFIFLVCGMVILTIVNSLTIGILERSTEIGTLKALGFSSQSVVNMFIKESIWLTLMSALIGFIISELISFLVNSANIRFTPPGIEGDVQFKLLTSYSFYLINGLGIFIISVVTTYFISKRKLQLSIINLLSESRK